MSEYRIKEKEGKLILKRSDQNAESGDGERRELAKTRGGRRVGWCPWICGPVDDHSSLFLPKKMMPSLQQNFANLFKKRMIMVYIIISLVLISFLEILYNGQPGC